MWTRAMHVRPLALLAVVLVAAPVRAQRAAVFDNSPNRRPTGTNAESGNRALAGFVPAVNAYDTAGECVRGPADESPRTIVVAYPSFDAARTVVRTTLDGRMILRVDEYRLERPVALPRDHGETLGLALTGDSVRAMRHMHLRLEFMGNPMGVAENDYARYFKGRARVESARDSRQMVAASLADFEAMSRLGNVRARGQRAVALCDRLVPTP